MKLMVISDIHGSSLYMNKAYLEFKNGNYDKLLILGDVLYHGPRNDLPEGYNPKEVIKILNQIKDKIICVEGNCDAYVDQMVLEFPILKSAMVLNDGISYYMTHGHIYNPLNPLNVSEGVVLYGHTHISKIELVDHVYYINPGSISIPKGNGIHSFIKIIDKKISICDFSNHILDEITL